MSEEEVKSIVKTGESISKEDMDAIGMAKVNVAGAKTQAEKAIALAEKAAAESRVADLEYRSLVQHIFLKYRMDLEDRIDDNTGAILRKSEEEAAAQAAAKEDK